MWTARVDTGMPILYKNPAEVGADRILNGVAAFRLYGRERRAPMIVVDFGTATTFDAISAKGEYLGGIIAPGMQISADALFQRAARLPRVDMKKPCEVIGRTTVGAIESGLYYGYVGLVDGLVRRMRDELGQNARLYRDGRTGRGDCARSGSHRARRPGFDAPGIENGVGEKQTPLSGAVRPEMDTDEVLPRDRSLPLPQERRPPDQNRRTFFRACPQLVRTGHSVEDRVPGHRHLLREVLRQGRSTPAGADRFLRERHP